MDLDKLEELFAESYRKLCEKQEKEPLENSSFYIDWCDKHKIIMLHPEWLIETLNEGKMRGRVCIHSPEGGSDPFAPWLLVPKKMAEKALVLGHLP